MKTNNYLFPQDEVETDCIPYISPTNMRVAGSKIVHQHVVSLIVGQVYKLTIDPPGAKLIVEVKHVDTDEIENYHYRPESQFVFYFLAKAVNCMIRFHAEDNFHQDVVIQNLSLVSMNRTVNDDVATDRMSWYSTEKYLMSLSRTLSESEHADEIVTSKLASITPPLTSSKRKLNVKTKKSRMKPSNLALALVNSLNRKPK